MNQIAKYCNLLSGDYLLVINNQLLLLKLPILFLFWWFVQAPAKILVFLFKYFIHLSQVLSVPLLIKTFFVPWKNENKNGYVAIGRGVGMTVKSFVLFADLVILVVFFGIEIAILFSWVLLPIISLYILAITIIK